MSKEGSPDRNRFIGPTLAAAMTLCTGVAEAQGNNIETEASELETVPEHTVITSEMEKDAQRRELEVQIQKEYFRIQRFRV